MSEKRYVVIDDAAFIREILKGIMTEMGHHCVGEAADGNQAKVLVQKTLPDYVFVDMVLPDKSGLSALAEMKAYWPEAKYIICTSLELPALQRISKDFSFDAFISKPFSREQVREKIMSFEKLNEEAI